jgi:hypothetical protein
VIEGGKKKIREVIEYVKEKKNVKVVVCDG